MLRMESVKSISMKEVAGVLGIQYNTEHHQHCPFPNHADVGSPSMKFYDNNSFACFGCQKGGSNIDLVMGVKDLSFKQAIVWLETNLLRVHRKPEGLKLANKFKSLKKRLVSRNSPDHKISTFDFSAYKSYVGAVITERRDTLLSSTEGTLSSLIDNKAEELYDYAEAHITHGVSEEQAAGVLQYVNHSLDVLGDILDEFRINSGDNAKG